MTLHKWIGKADPAIVLLGGFLLVIFLGTLALKLPISTQNGFISWIDACFTATSAVCVTGLIVVDTGSYFTLPGQIIILILIQIGGLGVMTISVALFQWMGRQISIRNRMAIQDLFAHTPREDIFQLVKHVLMVTFIMEASGTVFLTIHWMHEFPFSRALYTAIFHSVSAFCNAGFALFSDSMMQYRSSILLNTVLCSLIVVGGIGFPVLYDFNSWIRNRSSRKRLSIHTKTVLLTTLVLILAGTGMFALLEEPGSTADLSTAEQILTPLFQSITCRTAGFNTVDIGALAPPTLLMMIFLMFFGASPGSCGGGVKTTTLAVLAAFTVSRIRRSKRVNMFHKSIPADTVGRSISLALISIGIIFLVLFMVLAGMSWTAGAGNNPNPSFLACFFETVSAFGTVGLSMGITPHLGSWGKVWILMLMIVGRVGVLTFAYIVVGSGATNGVEYSEENLMIG